VEHPWQSLSVEGPRITNLGKVALIMSILLVVFFIAILIRCHFYRHSKVKDSGLLEEAKEERFDFVFSDSKHREICV